GSPRPGLPIAMQFSTSLDQPEDLELAYLGVPDSPEARAVIDLFLATQGWRRIVESGARGGQGTAPSSRDRDSAAVALFALDNLGEAQKRYLQEVEEEVSKARAGLASRLQDLHQGAARQNLLNAARELSEYQAHEGVPEVGGEIIQKAQQGLLARTENRTGGLIAFIHGDQGPRVQRPLPKPSGPLPLREYTYELNQKPASSSVSTDTLL